jgi:hypothetical protein
VTKSYVAYRRSGRRRATHANTAVLKKSNCCCWSKPAAVMSRPGECHITDDAEAEDDFGAAKLFSVRWRGGGRGCTWNGVAQAVSDGGHESCGGGGGGGRMRRDAEREGSAWVGDVLQDAAQAVGVGLDNDVGRRGGVGGGGAVWQQKKTQRMQNDLLLSLGINAHESGGGEAAAGDCALKMEQFDVGLVREGVVVLAKDAW